MYNIMAIGGQLVAIINAVYNGIKYCYKILIFQWTHYLASIVGLLCTLVIMVSSYIYCLIRAFLN